MNCPYCDCSAYVGFTNIECSNSYCQYYKATEQFKNPCINNLILSCAQSKIFEYFGDISIYLENSRCWINETKLVKLIKSQYELVEKPSYIECEVCGLKFYIPHSVMRDRRADVLICSLDECGLFIDKNEDKIAGCKNCR